MNAPGNSHPTILAWVLASNRKERVDGRGVAFIISIHGLKDASLLSFKVFHNKPDFMPVML
jgi:hypothetical protein